MRGGGYRQSERGGIGQNEGGAYQAESGVAYVTYTHLLSNETPD